MRHFAVMLVLCAPLLAQFDHLVTNDDGSVLYFSSSLPMRGTQQFRHRKLFVVDATGVGLHTQREQERLIVPESNWPVSTYYSIEAAVLNGDGSALGVIARRDCYGGSGCLQVPRFHTEIGGREFRGAMSLSRNGRFALLSRDGSNLSYNALVDLSTGERLEWAGNPGVPSRYGRRLVTSEGTALTTSPGALGLVRFDSSTSVPVPDFVMEAVLDDQGKSVVYEAIQAPSVLRKLVHLDIASGSTRLLATAPYPMQPCLSHDGQVVMFVGSGAPAPSQMFAIRPDGTGLRQLTRDPSGITDIVLSGDGKVAYAVTAAGRVLRVNLESGSVDEVIGRTAALTAPSPSNPPYPVPASAFAIDGWGFADTVSSAAPPLPLRWNGLELLLDGRPVPLQTVVPGRIVFQLPWDIGLGRHRLEVITEANPLFDTGPVDLEIRHQAFAQFELLGPEFRRSLSGQPYALAARQDFSSLVIPEKPARPGEVIHLYMTGLGPVEPVVGTGEPAPSDPPARITRPLFCRFTPRDIYDVERPAEVLFAGLAPGFAGYYQVTIRIPQEVSVLNGAAYLGCGFPRPESGTGAWIPMMEPGSQ